MAIAPFPLICGLRLSYCAAIPGEAVNVFAVALIVAGFMLAAIRYLLRFRALAVEENFTGFKIERGHALTLELLVVAAIIKTVTFDPTLENLEILILMIVIRTIIGWTTALEMNNRWPWQRP
jgi:uncharacterized membrane protein